MPEFHNTAGNMGTDYSRIEFAQVAMGHGGISFQIYLNKEKVGADPFRDCSTVITRADAVQFYNELGKMLNLPSILVGDGDTPNTKETKEVPAVRVVKQTRLETLL